MDPADGAELLGAVFRLVVADHSALQKFSVRVIKPDRIESRAQRMLQEGFGRFPGMQSRLVAERVQSRERPAAKIVQQFLCFFGSDFQRPGEPPAQRAVQQGIADEEHENHGQQRNRHGSQDHLRFEARTELRLAALHAQPHEAANKDQAEDQQRGGDEAETAIQAR